MIDLLHGDCCDILPTLPEQSVQCVVTSPPYYALRDYGLPPTIWPTITYTPLAGLPPITIPGCDPDCAHAWGPPIRAPWANANPGPNGRAKNTEASRSRGSMSGESCEHCGGWRGALGLEPDPLMFTAHLVHIFRLVWRVLRDDGTCWVNLGDSYASGGKGGGGSYMEQRKEAGWQKQSTLNGRRSAPEGLKNKDLLGIPWRVALALQADGWYLRSDVIWWKKNGMPEAATDRPTKAHEYVFFLAKSERYFYDAEAVAEPVAESSQKRAHLGKRPISKHQQNMQDLGMHGASDTLRVYDRETRNRRTVWHLAAKSGGDGVHFATFPEELVEPCLLASTASQACEQCGAPWQLVYEATGHVNGREQAQQPGRRDSTKTDSTGWRPTKRATDRRAPSCDCAGNTGSGRCAVLDPFAGTFTVGRVALRYGRRAIGIELNKQYLELGDKRTDGVQIEMEAYL